MKLNNTLKKHGLAILAGSMVLAGSARADGIDTSAAVTAITGAGVAVAVIGAAVLVVKVGVRVFKWAAAAL